MEDLLDFFNIVLCFRCCRQHDLCYESLPKRPCSSSFFGPYFTFYTWTIIRTTSGSNSSSQGQRSGTLAIRCGKHFRFIFRFSIRLSNCTTSVWGFFFFSDDTDVCKLATCNCDRSAAECMARHSASYNTANKRGSIWDWLI